MDKKVQNIATHNPEVVGSSPASATIKIPVFVVNTGIFLTFWAVFEQPILHFGPILGQWARKLLFWVTVRDLRAAFLCLFPEQHISDAFGRFGLVFFDDMAIDIPRSDDAGMA